MSPVAELTNSHLPAGKVSPEWLARSVPLGGANVPTLPPLGQGVQMQRAAFAMLAREDHIREMSEWADYLAWLDAARRPEMNWTKAEYEGALWIAPDAEVRHELQQALQRWWKWSRKRSHPERDHGFLPGPRYALRMYWNARAACEQDINVDIFFTRRLLAIGEPGHPGADPIWIPIGSGRDLGRDNDRPDIIRGENIVYFNAHVLPYVEWHAFVTGDPRVLADRFAAEHPTWGQRKLWTEWRKIPSHPRIAEKFFPKLPRG